MIDPQKLIEVTIKAFAVLALPAISYALSLSGDIQRLEAQTLAEGARLGRVERALEELEDRSRKQTEQIIEMKTILKIIEKKITFGQ
jgi:hypothetical protein